ncbi:MAG: glycosyl hydrolase family 28-related protein [Granulicella sp.]
MSAIRLVVLVALATASIVQAQSFYPVRLEDKAAVYLTGAKADGIADDTEVLQKAIDKVADTTHQGIVFIPSGHYRLTHTLFVCQASA